MLLEGAHKPEGRTTNNKECIFSIPSIITRTAAAWMQDDVSSAASSMRCVRVELVPNRERAEIINPADRLGRTGVPIFIVVLDNQRARIRIRVETNSEHLQNARSRRRRTPLLDAHSACAGAQPGPFLPTPSFLSTREQRLG